MPNPAHASEAPLIAVPYEHSASFLRILLQLQATLFVSTYQAGKLVIVGVHGENLAFSFHEFHEATGVAVQPESIAVGTKRQIWLLHAAHQIAPYVKPAGKYDGCFLARLSRVVGEMQVHEMCWGPNSELWLVNTAFSCLCTLHDSYDFVPRWKPPFISDLLAEDRCHLNGLAMENGKPKYVTALAETDVNGGWRRDKASTGCLIDVPTGTVVARGFAMPHSPRIHNGQVWLLDSGRGQIKTIDVQSGSCEVVTEVPGYTRGCAMHGPFAFVGMSRIRQATVFSDIPIAEKRDQLKCGVEVIDLRSGRSIARLELQSGVEEIFDVQLLPGFRFPAIVGPEPHVDGGEPIWLVGPPSS